MKTATIPSLRVSPELRQAAESVLGKNETLSGFVEQAIRDNIERRKLQAEFIARGLASREEAKRSGEYYAVEDVMAGLDAMFTEAKARGKNKARA